MRLGHKCFNYRGNESDTKNKESLVRPLM
jgi:hypothetical protein